MDMRFLPNSFLLLFAFTALSVVGCKRTVAPVVEPVDPNEIVINALPPSISVANRATLPTTFGAGSTVGLYTRLKNEGDPTAVLQANCYYSYSTPHWAPFTKGDKLLYDLSGRPIYIYGYHPNTAVNGSTTSFAIDGDLKYIKYDMVRNFSTLDSLVMSDFMWSKATGVDANGNVTDEGYIRQIAPVTLPFRHTLSKLSVLVKIIDSYPTGNSSPLVSIKKMWIEGNDFNKIATLGIFSGNVAFTGGDVNVQDTVFWNAPTGGLTAMIDGDATFITDMILIPFSVTKGNTVLKVLLESEGRELMFRADLPVYTGAAYPAPADATQIRFAQNDYNRITLTIDVSSQYINLEGKIEPWSPGNDFELGTDKE